MRPLLSSSFRMNMAEHAMVQIPKRQAKTSILLWDHPEPSQDPGWLKEVEADAPTLQSVCVLQSLKVAVGETGEEMVPRWPKLSGGHAESNKWRNYLGAMVML